MLTKKTMFRKELLLTLLIGLPITNLAQELIDSVQITKTLNEVTISALRANEKTPVAFTNISKSEIEKGNLKGNKKGNLKEI